jgi:hypothetical protein
VSAPYGAVYPLTGWHTECYSDRTMITEQQFNLIEAQHHITVAALHLAKQRAIRARLTNDARNIIEAQKQLVTLTER